MAPLAFVVKTVDLGDVRALMIASQQDDLAREPDHQCEEQADNLSRLLAAVHVIAHEQVARIWVEDAFTAQTVLRLFSVLHLLEHVHDIFELAVDVAEDFDRSFKSHDGALIFEMSHRLLD